MNAPTCCFICTLPRLRLDPPPFRIAQPVTLLLHVLHYRWPAVTRQIVSIIVTLYFRSQQFLREHVYRRPVQNKPKDKNFLPFMQAAFCVKRYIVFGSSLSLISTPNVMLFVDVVQVVVVNAECCLYLD